jgi:YHS domain-containing protein
MKLASCVALGLVAAALAACGAESSPPAKPAPAKPTGPQISYQVLKPEEMSLPSKYPLKTCAVSGKELATLGHKPYAISWKGYEMQFCSEKCVDEFARDPEKYVLMMNPRAMFK